MDEGGGIDGVKTAAVEPFISRLSHIRAAQKVLPTFFSFSLPGIGVAKETARNSSICSGQTDALGRG